MAKKAQDDRVFIQNAVKTLATNIRFASVAWRPLSRLFILEKSGTTNSAIVTFAR